MFVDNKEGGLAYPMPLAGLPSQRHRAVLVGSVWSSDLAETLREVYAPWINEGYSLEDVARMVGEPCDDGPGD